MVPLDGSKNSLRGLRFALGIAKKSGSLIIGLSVNFSPTFAKPSPFSHKIEEKVKDIIKQAKTLSKKNEVLFIGKTKVSKNIGKEIISYAESNKVDMIVIGSRGPDAELGVFLGSVANYVVNKSKVPVTVVK